MTQRQGNLELGTRLLTRLVNVLSIIYCHVYFPVYSNGLKDVAGLLGFKWTDPSASGALSVAWRRKWELSGSQQIKDVLLQYNQDDCRALQMVTTFLYEACSQQNLGEYDGSSELRGWPVTQVERLEPPFRRPDWGTIDFAIPDFEFVNQRAYFDYQRQKVFIRTNKPLRKRKTRRSAKVNWRKLHPNSDIEISSANCQSCGGSDLTRMADGRLCRMVFDIRFTRAGIRRQTTLVLNQA